jgi:formamidopyrimidine-DNA glycosylase
MPELAEVEFYRRQWDPGLGGVVLDVRVHPAARVFRTCPDPFRIPEALAGRRFTASYAHGKNLLFEFSGGAWLALHLGMTGKLFAASVGGGGAGGAVLHRPGAPAADHPRHHHLAVVQRGRELVFSDPRMFGSVALHLGQRRPGSWLELPPAVLSPAFTRRRCDEFLTKHPNRPLKALLLDQGLFPGFGNWMADEALWRARLHPGARAGELGAGEAGALFRAVRRVAGDALRVIAPDWGEPPGSWLFRHRWTDGGRCPRRGCRAQLARATLAGRTACWCPSCQPAPRPLRSR